MTTTVCYEIEIILKSGTSVQVDCTEFKVDSQEVSWKSPFSKQQLLHVKVDEIAAVIMRGCYDLEEE